MVVIAANAFRGIRPHPVDAFRRLRRIVHDVTEHQAGVETPRHHPAHDRLAHPTDAEAALQAAQSLSMSPTLPDAERLELIDALHDLAERRRRQPWPQG